MNKTFASKYYEVYTDEVFNVMYKVHLLTAFIFTYDKLTPEVVIKNKNVAEEKLLHP